MESRLRQVKIVLFVDVVNFTHFTVRDMFWQ